VPTLDQIKAQARQKLHGLAAVSCDLIDVDHPDGLVFAAEYTGETLTVRYHTKLDQTGDLDGNYGEVLDGIDRLVFHDDNLAAVSQALVDNGEAPLVIARGAKITIPSYKNLAFKLDTLEPPDGPGETIWVVARTRS